MKRLLLLLTVAATLSAAELYRVAGVLVDSETGSPIANASLALSPGGESRGELVTSAGSDGRFGFDAPRGKFTLSAVVAGRSEKFGLTSPFAGMGCAVITGPDQDTAHLVFRWYRPVVIAGRVLDDQGEPVERARVQLLYSGVVGGRSRITPLTDAWTDDRGDYRIWWVSGATYYLVVTAQPWYGNNGLARLGQTQAPVAYATVYYPGTTDIARAAPLTVPSGGEAHADFTLTAVAAATITVNCDNDAAGEASATQRRGGMTARVIAEGIGGTETVVSQPPVFRCPFTVNGVLPGRYLLRLSNTGTANPLVAQQWIDVGAGDMAVSLSLHPPASVRGNVTLKSGGARPGGTLVVHLSREAGNTSVSMAVGTDGGFSVPRIEPGKYRVFVSGAGYYAETIRAGDTALPDGVVNIEDGVESRLNIVASNESGRLKGYATRDDQPVANMLVVLVPRDPASGYPNQPFQTDSDGSFDWPPTRAGDYLLFAVDDPTVAWADPQTVRPYLSQAKSIRIEPGKVTEERVPVQAAAR